MNGGEWRIRQQPPHGTAGSGAGSGYRVEVIPVTRPATGASEPDIHIEDACITFNHKDGRTVIYPWHNIISAEYVPDPEDT